MSMQTREQMLLDLAVKAHRDLIAQARAEGERAGQIAMREQCARFLDGSADGAAAFAEVYERERDYDYAGMQRAEESIVRELASAIRALKVEGETE